MTAIGQEDGLVRARDARLEPTFAMILVGVGSWALAVGVAIFLAYSAVVYAPAIEDDRFVASVLPVFLLVAAILVVAGSLAVFWRRARRHPSFWLLPVLLAILVLAGNAQDIPYDLARPANTTPFLITIIVLPGALAAIGGGVAAFLEVRRGRAVWSRRGRVGWASMGILGIVLGAATASVLAGRASAGGPGGADVPTVSGLVHIEARRFVESSLRMNDGEILGLFVTNPENIWHTFDIDSLGIAVELAPNSTTAVVIRPNGSGQLVFYSSVHGHRAAGMAGTITVQ